MPCAFTLFLSHSEFQMIIGFICRKLWSTRCVKTSDEFERSTWTRGEMKPSTFALCYKDVAMLDFCVDVKKLFGFCNPFWFNVTLQLSTLQTWNGQPTNLPFNFLFLAGSHYLLGALGCRLWASCVACTFCWFSYRINRIIWHLYGQNMVVIWCIFHVCCFSYL